MEWGKGRGALLGPEESGPARRELVLSGGWFCFFKGHELHPVGVVGGWGRLSPNRWCGCLDLGCVVSLGLLGCLR